MLNRCKSTSVDRLYETGAGQVLRKLFRENSLVKDNLIAAFSGVCKSTFATSIAKYNAV